MSLGVVIKGPEGIILAADSRVTLQVNRPGLASQVVNYDNTSKLFSFSEPHNYVGVVTYGAALIGNRTPFSFVPEIEQDILSKESERLIVEEYAKKISGFYMKLWEKEMARDQKDPDMTFIVGGYGPKDAYGNVYLFQIPSRPNPEPRNKDDFGMTWGGQLQVATRIIHGYDPSLIGIVRSVLNLDDKQAQLIEGELRKNLEFPIPYQVLPLQDCVNLAIFLIRSTINAQDLSVGVRGVGGLIEVAVITRTKSINFIQRKELRAE